MTLKPLKIPDLLDRYRLQPKKSLGQNFLADHNALLKIVQDAGLDGNDEVLEIGAGLGSLTRILASQAKKVVAVELDRHLFPVLRDVTAPFKNIELVQGDILNIPPADLGLKQGYKVVANIPYYITSAVIRHLLEAENKPCKLVLTMQREVAERIVNADEKMSLLSLSVQVYGKAHISNHIPAACFIPQPSVDSSVLIIDVDRSPKLSPQQVERLFDLAHAAFNQKRKMLRSSLKSILGDETDLVSDMIGRAGVDPKARPETLSLEVWIQLTKVLNKEGE